MFLLCVVPPFEGWDEYQHVAYVVHLIQEGTRPVLGEALVPDALLEQVVRFPASDHALEGVGGAGAVGYRDFWDARPDAPALGPRSSQRVAGAPRHPLYEAQHAPLPYWLAVPVFEGAGSLGHIEASLAALRLQSLLFATVAIWILLGWLGRNVRPASTAGLVGLLLVLQPLIGIDFARFSNDGLGFLLGTIVVVRTLGLRACGTPPRVWELATLGLLLAAAVLAKALALALVPFVAATLCFAARPTGAKGAWLRAPAVAMAGFALGFSFEAVHNQLTYGSPLSIRDTLSTIEAEGSLTDALRHATGVGWVSFTHALWARQTLFAGGWSFVPAPGFFRTAHVWLTDLALAGFVIGVLRGGLRRVSITSRANVLAAAGVVVCFHAAACAHVLMMISAWGIAVTLPHYLVVALPWFLLLLVQGSRGWSSGALGAGIPVLLALVFAATNVAGPLLRMLPFYAQAPFGPLAWERVASLQPAALGSFTLGLSLATWLGLSVRVLVVLLRRVGLRGASDPDAAGPGFGTER